MLSVIQKRVIITLDQKDVNTIFLLKTGTGIKLGDFWANPDYLLGVAVDEDIEFVSVMYENDIQTWIESEKRDDLQTFSFFIVIGAVFFDLISDIPLDDLLGVKIKIINKIESTFRHFRK